MGKIGRNDPCLCGSEKKYKKCCLSKNVSSGDVSVSGKFQILPLYDKINYGMPLLDNHFFEDNKPQHLSAAHLMYTRLLSPKMTEVAANLVRHETNRAEKESTIIDKIDNAQDLISILDKKSRSSKSQAISK